PLLILLMLAACGVGLAAADSGRLRTLVWCGVLVGLAVNTKSLAALLVVALVAAVAWSLAVDLAPSSQRPFIGSPSSNTEFQLEFGYNGFGRVGGQQG